MRDGYRSRRKEKEWDRQQVGWDGKRGEGEREKRQYTRGRNSKGRERGETKGQGRGNSK